MRKFFTSLSVVSLLAVAPGVAIAAPAATDAVAVAPAATTAAPVAGPTALETFTASHKAVEALVDSGADNAKVEAEVDRLLDYDWIATAALGGPKKYAKRCDGHCNQFNGLLTRLIRRNYLKRISAKDNGVVVIIQETVRMRKGKPIAKVDTVVTFTAPDDGRPQTLEVSYVMHQVDGVWQVRDMLTDGLSLAKTWKHDFGQLYKEGGMTAVETRLQGKLGELDDLAKN